MDLARHVRLSQLLHEALALRGDELDDFLEGVRLGDAEMAGDLEHLLEEETTGESGKVSGRQIPARYQRIGRYETREAVGTGGMNEGLFKAWDAEAKRFVAIKLLAARDAELERSFRQERDALARLANRFIVTLLEYGRIPGEDTLWLATEWVEGQTIARYCRERNLSLTDRVRLFQQVCVAVHYAHDLAILHRDLKPSNIMVKAPETGQPEAEVRLLDFGIARPMEDAERQTMMGRSFLSPDYASPERLRQEPATVRSEVFSLGVVLFELLAGWHRCGEPYTPSARADRLTGVSPSRWRDLDAICAKATAAKPGERYGTVAALTEDLQRLWRDEPLEARRQEGPSYRAGKFVRRHWPGLALAGGVLLIVSAIAGWFTYRLTAARDAALQEAARREQAQEGLQDFIELSMKATGARNTALAASLLDADARRTRTVQSPSHRASRNMILGRAYQSIGQFDKADACFRDALETRRRSGDRLAERVESLTALGNLRVTQGKFSEGNRLLEEATDLAKRSLPVGDPDRTGAISRLGKGLVDAGQQPVGLRLLRQAEEESRIGSPESHEGAMLLLANGEHYSSNFPKAIELNQQLAKEFVRRRGEGHPALVDVLCNLGAASHRLGKEAQAESYFRQMLSLARATYPEDHPEVASAFYWLGISLYAQKKNDEAIQATETSLAIRRRVYGLDHPNTINAMGQLGNLLGDAGDLEGRRRLLTEVLEASLRAYPEPHLHVSIAKANLATAYLKDMVDLPRAEKLFREALAGNLQLGLAKHDDTGVTRIKLGVTLERRGRLEEARRELLAGQAILRELGAQELSFFKYADQRLKEIEKKMATPALAAAKK